MASNAPKTKRDEGGQASKTRDGKKTAPTPQSAKVAGGAKKAKK